MSKLRRLLGLLPFSEDVVAAAHCATDGATPLAVRITLFGAFAYFVMPFDIVPDFILGLGYLDDAGILAAAYAAARSHVTEMHRTKARRWLLKAPVSPAA